MFKKLLGIVLLLLSSACFPLSPYALNHISRGMSMQEVQANFGSPHSTLINGNLTILVYYLNDSVFSFFTSSRFPFVGIYPLARTGTEYWLVFQHQEDGTEKLIFAGTRIDYLKLHKTVQSN